MTSISVQNDKVLCEFDKSMYSQKAIDQAIVDYTEISYVNYTHDDRTFLVELKPKEKEVKLSELGFEFMNYVLSFV